jgi:hypothetical protein
MVLYEFICNATMHIFLIIIIQIGLFKFIISKAESDDINLAIVDALKQSAFYNTIKENLQIYQFPQTCVKSDNNNWTVNLYLIATIAALATLVITISLNAYGQLNINSIFKIIIQNIILFTAIAIVEYIFYLKVISKYQPISINDIKVILLNNINALMDISEEPSQTMPATTATAAKTTAPASTSAPVSAFNNL